jgi:hypothetical protein
MLTRLSAVLARVGGPLALLTIAVAFSGCGGSSESGLASKSASEILAASKDAADSASSVRIASKSSLGPLSLLLNVDLARPGGRGQVAVGGLSFEVIRTGNTLYLKGNPAFERNLRTTTGLQAPRGGWLKVPINSNQLAQLASVTDLSGELSRLLTRAGPISKGATTTVNGQQAIELKETARLFSGSLYVATSGKPYPLKFVKSGRETGQTTFSGWNEPVSLSAPPNAIAGSQLEQGGH